MMMPMERDLPFKTDEAYHGFAEIQGLLHVERDHLLLEFELKDALFGVLKSGAKELKISYLDLNHVAYRRSWVKSRLVLQVNNMRVLSAFPGAKDGTIDVYAVIETFDVQCPARQHAIKKLLCSGIRGKGNAIQDLKETRVAIDRAIKLQEER